MRYVVRSAECHPVPESMPRIPFFFPLSALVVLAVSIGGVTRIKWDADGGNVLPPGLPAVEGLMALRGGFSRNDELIITLKGETPAVVDAAAAGLASRFSGHPEVAMVVDPSSTRVLIRDVEAFDARPDLRAAAAALVAFARMEQDPKEFDVLARVLAHDTLLDAHLDEIEEIIRFAEPEDAMLAARDPLGLFRGLSEAMSGAPPAGALMAEAASGKFRSVSLRASHPRMNAAEGMAWVARLSPAVEEWRTTAPEARAVRVMLTGEPVQLAATLGGMKRDMTVSVLGTAMMITLLFWLLHRRLRPLLGLLFFLGVTFFITLGLGGWIFGRLSIVSVGFAAILLGLAVDYAAIIYQASLTDGANPAAIRRHAGPGILWGAATTGVVFAALVFSSIPGIRQLGALVALGVAVACVVMLGVFAPVCAAWRRGSAPVPQQWKKVTTRSWRRLAATPFLWLALVVILVTTGMPPLSRDFTILRPKNNPAMNAYDEMLAAFNPGQLPRVALVLKSDNAEDIIGRRAAAVRKLEASVASGEVAAWFLPGRNAEAIAGLLTRESQVLEQLAARNLYDATTLEFAARVFRSWRVFLHGDSGDLPVAEDGVILAGLDRIFSLDPDRRTWLGQVEAADAAAFRAFDFSWKDGFTGDGLLVGAWETIGPELLRLVAEDGRHLAIPLALLLVLMLLIVFRNAADVVLALTALAAGGLTLLVIMKIAGWEWNFLNLSAIPLLFGAGIDYTLHMILALRRSGGDMAVVRTGIRKALLFCALTTSCGFASLALAENAGLASLGRVCAAGILGITLFSLFFLPQWWLFLHQRRMNRRLSG